MGRGGIAHLFIFLCFCCCGLTPTDRLRDKKFYTRDEFYPSDVVEVTGPFEIDGYNALLVPVRPFQYNPTKRKLIGFGNIAVTINVSAKEGELDEYPLSDPELNTKAYGNLFLNPRRSVEERLEIEPGGITVRSIPRGPEFLIIYHDTFRNAAERLAKWKILLLHK